MVERLAEAEVPCAKVADIPAVTENPQLRHRGQITAIDHPTIGQMPMQGLTIGFSDSPGALKRPAPSIGQHTDEVLAEWLRMPADEIAALRAAGAV